MLRVTFNHGLRVSETLSITAKHITETHLMVERGKGSNDVCHRLLPEEKIALRDLCSRRPVGRLWPMSRSTFWRRMQRYGAEAGIPIFLCHPHALKHTTGRLGYLGGMKVPEIVAYLGHKNPGNSLRYMQASEEEASHAFAAAIGGK